jgi:hypothetical protein
MTDIAGWTALAEKIGAAGHEIFRTAEVQITEKGYADEKFLALTLLARTMSNLKGALLLLHAERIVEARTITRCCFENEYWVVALVEQGEAFARKMVHDGVGHRRARGQLIFQSAVQLEASVKDRLRGWMKRAKQQFTDAKTLNPKEVASVRPDFEKTYIFYAQLSSDAAHPSIDALHRYLVPHNGDEIGGVDIEPVVNDTEIELTLYYLCCGVMGVCVGVNQMLGGTSGGKVLNRLADEFSSLSADAKGS